MEGGSFLWEMDVITIYQIATGMIAVCAVADFYSLF